MSTVLVIIGGLLGIFLLIVMFACCIFAVQYFVWFHWRICPHCYHALDFKGLKEKEGGEYYEFHCPHCGRWEILPKEQFFREYGEPINKENKF